MKFQREKKQYIKLILIFAFGIFFAGCASKKGDKIVLPADFKGPKALEKIYGVRITQYDNIYLYNEGARWMGVKHRLGGSSKSGTDCSGLVYNIYQEVYNKKLSRSSEDILKNDCKKISRKDLQEGDLVFFRSIGGKSKKPNHVGIYLKNEKFIHTSSSGGVIVSSLNEPYYLRTWLTGGRVK